MSLASFQQYWILLLLVVFFSWRWLRLSWVRRQLPGLLKRGAVVVDVRSPSEFTSGAREGSINIPLGELDSGSAMLPADVPIVLCCASGTRSAMAKGILKRKGFKEVINAGSWSNTVL